MNQDTRTTDVAGALLQAAEAELAEHGAGGISLRAVARRAGVSHAAPKHHFQDRAGLLTALAVTGFRRLTAALHLADPGPGHPADRIAVLGRAYLDFGLAQPTLFELMFRPDQLHREDPELDRAYRESFGVLVGVAGTGGPAGWSADDVSLLGWIFAHGLVVLIRTGALAELTGARGDAEVAALAQRLTTMFTDGIRGPHPGTE